MKFNSFGSFCYFVFLLLFVPNEGYAKNITKQVINQTTFDERIADACSGKCGNRGHSRITSVDITRIDNRFHRVVVAYAKYHDHKDPPKIFGNPIGGGIGVEYTIDLTAIGKLDDQTCMLKVEIVHIRGDKYNLAKDAKKEQGKSHHWENCQNFI